MLVTQLAAKKEGYSDVVYLDAKSDTYLEEVSSCNIFCVKGKTIKTPPLSVRVALALEIRPNRCLPGLRGCSAVLRTARAVEAGPLYIVVLYTQLAIT